LGGKSKKSAGEREGPLNRVGGRAKHRSAGEEGGEKQEVEFDRRVEKKSDFSFLYHWGTRSQREVE